MVTISLNNEVGIAITADKNHIIIIVIIIVLVEAEELLNEETHLHRLNAIAAIVSEET